LKSVCRNKHVLQHWPQQIASLTSLDISVPNFSEFSFAVDAVPPSDNWPENLKKDWYNLKDDVWIPKDCTSHEPIVMSEDQVVRRLVFLFKEIHRVSVS
jgi:hypothetical protein